MYDSSLSGSYRITGQVGLEGTVKSHLIQTFCHGQEHLPLDQVAPQPVQLCLEHFQGWTSTHYSLCNLFQCLSILIIKNISIYPISIYPLPAEHHYLLSCLYRHQYKVSFHRNLSSLYILKGRHRRFPQNLFLSRVNNSNTLSFVRGFHLLIILMDLLQT